MKRDDIVLDETMRGEVKQPTFLLLQIQAGRSILTVRSNKTQSRYTFRFRRPDPMPGKTTPIWVSMLGGPEDGRNWSFLGTIWPHEGRWWTFNRSPKSKVPADDRVFVVLEWINRYLPAAPDALMEQSTWWHEGCCGRCGRRLTVPESIETGFGPDCAGKMGIA